MIKTQDDYKSALDSIDEDIELYDFELPKKMDSRIYNLYLQDIEYFLDKLYEKYRTIEDLYDYLKVYNDTKINKILTEIKEKENKLDSIVDKYTGNKSVILNPEWDENYENVYDRDGTLLNKAYVDENKITPGRIFKSSVSIKNISKESSNQPTYFDNVEMCLTTGSYVSSYVLDYPTEINETLAVKLDDINDFKFIEVRPLNCEIEKQIKNNNTYFILKAKSMTKIREDFSLESYSKSQLDSFRSKGIAEYNNNHDFKENYNDIVDSLNVQLKSSYIGNTIKNQNNNEKNNNIADVYGVENEK